MEGRRALCHGQTKDKHSGSSTAKTTRECWDCSLWKATPLSGISHQSFPGLPACESQALSDAVTLKGAGSPLFLAAIALTEPGFPVCFPRKFSLEDVLTNIMIYWTTGTIVSSQRYYKENLGQGIMAHRHEG